MTGRSYLSQFSQPYSGSSSVLIGHTDMKNFIWWSCLLLASTGFAQSGDTVTKDVAGQDHPLLKRYEGSLIVAFTTKAYDAYNLVLGKALNPSADRSQGKRIEKEQTVEGRITRITYLAPVGRSALEVSKNYENELKNQRCRDALSRGKSRRARLRLRGPSAIRRPQRPTLRLQSHQGVLRRVQAG